MKRDPKKCVKDTTTIILNCAETLFEEKARLLNRRAGEQFLMRKKKRAKMKQAHCRK
jgi:hypothetical protein